MNKEPDPRLRRVNAADMKAFDEEFPPELYVKWDGTGPTERLQWAATCLFESGRRVFHLDDNGIRGGKETVVHTESMLHAIGVAARELKCDATDIDSMTRLYR